MMVCAAIIIAYLPEAQTLFTVVQGVSVDKPANSAACLAGAWPKLALTTLPIYTSCTWSGAIPARSTAALMAIEPNSIAVNADSEPLNAPTGVRATETIYTSFIFCRAVTA